MGALTLTSLPGGVWTHRIIGSIVSLAAGGLLGLAFPEPGWWWTAPIAIAIITALQWDQRLRWGVWTGFLFGFAFFLQLQPWLTVVGTDAWILLSAYCALWTAGAGALTALVTRSRAAVLLVGAVWVVQEWGRSTIPFGGYAWGRVAYSAADAPLALGAHWWGMTGITFIVASLGAGIALLAIRAGERRPLKAPLTVLLVSIVVFYGLLPQVLPSMSTNSGQSTVAIVQGGTPQTGMGAMDVRAAVLSNHINVTRSLADAIANGSVDRPDLVVWPENASDIDPFTDPVAYDAIDSVVSEVGVPTLVGAVITSRTDETYRENVGILWIPQLGPVHIYSKNHPVPFGEFIPFREYLSGLTDRFDRIPRDFAAGMEPGIITLPTSSGEVVFGDAICFEVAYDDVMVTLVQQGAQFLTVQTNNATYAGTDQIAQQLAIEELRALQFERYVAIAATTGASAIIDPRGGEVATIPIDGQGFAVAQIERKVGTPISARVGLWPEYLSALAILIVLVRFRYSRTRTRRETPSGAGDPTTSPHSDE